MSIAYLCLSVMLVLAPFMASGRPADSVDTVFREPKQMMFPSYLPMVQQPNYPYHQQQVYAKIGWNPVIVADNGFRSNSPVEDRFGFALLACLLSGSCFGPAHNTFSNNNANRIPWLFAPWLASLQQQ
ncbi:hypothetical protein GHT06_010477 [Daphnia sinensis]|uniref:Uncharacterized protein n=1 Tax=Daphnia sinensis TaxID=1820382 RepID=A0AAD5LHU0_9CRUS|nr:hypothetical protein GHT06_010477 [Daphnia sinensis]